MLYRYTFIIVLSIKVLITNKFSTFTSNLQITYILPLQLTLTIYQLWASVLLFSLAHTLPKNKETISVVTEGFRS